MCWFVVGLLVLLCVVHQDFWWWDSRQLVFGFIPIGLAWHALISVAASIVWYLATVHCWPRALQVDPLTGIDAPEASATKETPAAEDR